VLTQSHAALGDLAAADRHAVAADALADQYDLPVVAVFTGWYAALAGASSGLVTLGPVAQHLGDLAAAPSRPAQAREHYTRAPAVAERAKAPHRAATARSALEQLVTPSP
jgi:hypothetical protein